MNRQMPSGDRYTDAPADIAEEINAAIPLVDDFPSPEELKRDLKRTITIRLDPEVYAWFQLPGPGYQTRINAVLRHYVAHQKAAKAAVQPEIIGRYSTYLKPKGAGKIAAKGASNVPGKRGGKAAGKGALRKPAKKRLYGREKESRLSKEEKRPVRA